MSSQAPSPPGTRPDLRVTGQDSPQARYQALGYRAKRLLLGPPLQTAQLVHERISKRIALAVFSSDPISSTAYATEEMLLVLVLAGSAGVALALPLAGGIALLLLILVVSYRQVIRAYPHGGGAYMVSRDILSLGGVVVYGIWRVAFGHAGPISYDPASSVGLVGPEGGVVTAVSLFLILHAFSAGTTALTGVEAIADGVPAFRKPEARNAQRTLLVMALIMVFLFLGITFLARQLEVQPYGSGNPTLVAQIARYVLGPGLGRGIFVFVQVATLAILVLAANTAFNGFPVLAYFAADDALLPRQLRKRGHRLVYSNGILVLAGAAIFLVIAFRADVHRLIPLYAIGVVTSFTLAQAGMTRLHLRQREEGWRQGLLINGVGALITFIVLCVIIITKFVAGAWMVVVAVPLIVLLLSRTRSAYAAELAELKVEASQRLAPPKPRHEVVVLLEDLDRAAIGALQYARQLNPLHITAVHVALDPDHARRLAGLWARINLPVPLEVIDCPDRNLLGCAHQTIAELVRPDTEVTVLVPKRGFAKFWHRVLHDRSATGLFKVLGTIDGVNGVIVPFRMGRRPILRPVPTDGYPTAPRA